MKFLHTLRQAINNLRLKNKFRAILLLNVVCIGISVIVSSRYLLKSYNDLLYEKSAVPLSMVSSKIESDMGEIEDISQFIATSKTVQSGIATLNSANEMVMGKWKAKQAITEIMTSFAGSNHNIINIALEENNGTISYGRDSSAESEAVHNKIVEIQKQNTGNPVWISTGREDSSILCVRSIRKTENLSLNSIGVLVIRVNLSNMVEDIKKETDSSKDTSLYIWNGNLPIYPVNNPDSMRIQEDRSSGLPYQILERNHIKYFVVSRTMDKVGWTCNIATNYNQVFHSVILSNLIFILLVIFFTFLSVLISNLLIQSVLVHLNTLIEKINSFKNGTRAKQSKRNYDYRQRRDELGLLHQEFDSMVERIEQLIEENYVKQILIKDTQLKMLQQQINPHFLFNTLESINWQAKIIGENNISQMTESLGALLRYSIDTKTDLVPIGKELSIVENYLQIQQIRFEDRLNFSYQVEDDLMKTLIPKMCIQPLVENAIKYSLEQITDVCTIKIIVTRKEDRVLICVKNNGSQIEPDIMEKLKTGEIKPNGSGVGLENINQRIQLIYGTEYGLSFENKDGNAIVILAVPDDAAQKTERNSIPDPAGDE